MEERRTFVSRIDPTHVSRWEQVRAEGKVAFLMRFGVPIAIPAALLLNAVLVWARGDIDVYWSARNAFEVIFTTLLVAPLLGVIIGQALWSRGERLSGYDVSIDDSVVPRAATEADEEQRRLSALKARLDELSRTAPHRLVWRVIGLTVLGYGYVLLVITALVTSVILLRGVHGDLEPFARIGAQLLAFFTFFVLMSLWVRVLEPTGRRITRAGSPALFAALDDIQRTLDAPSPDVVLIDGQLNASVSEHPKYGIFGLPKRYLVIGLLLFEALPADECKAILAHELAHLSRRHGRRLMWTARLSATWLNLAASLEAGAHWGRGFFLPFFRWYAPRFELHALAVARQDEHESDALAAECVGADTAARALLRLHVCQHLLNEALLRPEYRESAARAEPPSGVFERLAEALRAGPSRHDAERWTRRVLSAQTLSDHSHPSLANRMMSLGGQLGAGQGAVTAAVDLMNEHAAASGADELIGRGRLPKLRAQIEGDWQVEQLDVWRRLHADARIWRGSANQGEQVSDVEAWARARWAVVCEPPHAALPLIRDVIRRSPAHLEATIYLGQLLSESDDADERAEGARLLEQVLARDSALSLVAATALQAQYARLGALGDAERVSTRERQLKESVLKGLRERRELRAHDRLTAYPLPAPTLAALRKACAVQKDVMRAYLVRKKTDYLRDQACVMLAVECDVAWYKPATGADALAACHALLARITLPEEADLLVVAIERGRLRRVLRSIPGAELYRRA